MRNIFFILFLSITLLSGVMVLPGQSKKLPPGMAALLPELGADSVWKPSGTPQYVEGEDLFLLINGGAEIYQEYGFHSAASWSYKNKQGKYINLEIFRMSSPEAAYGVYSFKTGDSGKPVDVGARALLEDYYLNLWKGNILVTLTGGDSSPEVLEGINTLAKAAAAKIKEDAPLPALVMQLPKVFKEKLKPLSLKYVKGMLGLFNQYPFHYKNIFGLKEAVSADYENFRLYMFSYPDAATRQKWFQQAEKELKSDSAYKLYEPADNGFFLQDKKGVSLYFEGHGKYILVIQGKDKKEAAAITAKIKKDPLINKK